MGRPRLGCQEAEPPGRLRGLGGRTRRRERRRAAEDNGVRGRGGGSRRRRGSRGLGCRPVDGVEVESGRLVDLDAPILEAVHGRESQQPDLSEERLAQALGDEHDARRPATGAVAPRNQTPDGLRILERPRVGLDHPEEHRVVAREAERDERRRLASIHADELDCRPAEVDGGGEYAEARLHRLRVFGDKRLELGQVLDFVLPECQLHSDTDRATGVPVAEAHSSPPNQEVRAAWTLWTLSGAGHSGTREHDRPSRGVERSDRPEIDQC